MLNTSIGRLRFSGFFEGLSFFILLGVAIPFKYIVGIPVDVFAVGLFHGAFVVSHFDRPCIMVLAQTISGNLLLAFIAAFLPTDFQTI
ncbi:DUF3817 domain-containing protein [Priestia sp. LL-8]|uniref:DUF3817 domain-containing protein n=1 Tax=Priestia sp. LL-8 TaxID=3110068 RepID=UPI002E26890E|nr:DUF3817 domain-containing protein [Priestia sp. LL-8]